MPQKTDKTLIYYIVRAYVSFVLKFFIKQITITGQENIPKDGPVLIAANHPNSFFDAMVLACILERPVWSLARGDAFKKNWVKKILTSFYMMPIYRLSEGKEYLGENDATFAKSIELFKENQQVLIFSEGLCTNQTNLLPLKKGTARLSQKAWSRNIDMVIFPVGITYDKFDSFGKNINLNYGKTIKRSDFEEIGNDGYFVRDFNDKLKTTLESLMTRDFKNEGFFKNPLYYIGWLVNFPINFLSQAISRKMTKGTVFPDSVTVALMVLFLLIYWIIIWSMIFTNCC